MRFVESEEAILQILSEGYKCPSCFYFPVGAEDYIAFTRDYQIYVNNEQLGKGSERLYTCVKLVDGLIVYKVWEVCHIRDGSTLTGLKRYNLVSRLSGQVLWRLREILGKEKGL